MIWTGKFWKAAGERAIRTTAQAAVALLPTTAVALGSIDWALLGSASVVAGLVSVLTSVATGLPEVKDSE